MTQKKHIHKYHKVQLQYVKVWACANPYCNHHMPKNMEDLVIGRATYCWNCDAETFIDSMNAKLDKPLCPQCLFGNTEKLEDIFDALTQETKG